MNGTHEESSSGNNQADRGLEHSEGRKVKQ